jgi:hypothetical protein
MDDQVSLREGPALSLRLEPQMMKRLRLAAHARSRPVANLVRVILAEWLEQQGKREAA